MKNHRKKPIYKQKLYYDIETGELITKSLKERKYTESKKLIERKTIQYGDYTIERTEIGCWYTEQLRLL